MEWASAPPPPKRIKGNTKQSTQQEANTQPRTKRRRWNGQLQSLAATPFAPNNGRYDTHGGAALAHDRQTKPVSPMGFHPPPHINHPQATPPTTPIHHPQCPINDRPPPQTPPPSSALLKEHVGQRQRSGAARTWRGLTTHTSDSGAAESQSTIEFARGSVDHKARPTGVLNRRRGVWDPKICVPKMARSDFSDGELRCFPCSTSYAVLGVLIGPESAILLRTAWSSPVGLHRRAVLGKWEIALGTPTIV